MKKITILMLLIVTTAFVGCSNKSTDKSIEEKNNEVGRNVLDEGEKPDDAEENKATEDEGTEESESDNKDTNEAQSKKQSYLDKYSEIESELKTSLEAKYSGTTFDMREAADIEYKSWDDLLNEIYGVLQEQLSKEEMDSVREEQIKWLEIRDSKAEESSEEFEGGTMEPLTYEMSIATSTKERCYELINSYME